LFVIPQGFAVAVACSFVCHPVRDLLLLFSLLLQRHPSSTRQKSHSDRSCSQSPREQRSGEIRFYPNHQPSTLFITQT
jgi:hypothetical protein